MQLALKESRLGLRNSTTRIPFRYGTASLTRCPQATLRVTIECAGRTREGFSADCLPPSWFDKSPGKTFATQIDDILRIVAASQAVYADAFLREVAFFPTWLSCHDELQRRCRDWGLPLLLGCFGSSLVERAVIDALCRTYNVGFARAIRANLPGIDPGLVHAVLEGLVPADWLPCEPAQSIAVRHTVGLGDPLTSGDIPPGHDVHDGLPQTFEEYVARRGVSCCKVKLANRLDDDVERLTLVARLLQRYRGHDYRLTLDGNEQYKDAEAFEALIERIQAHPELDTLWQNVLAIEQPFDRAIGVGLDTSVGLRKIALAKPVIIDESDDALDAYPRAIQGGYRGVSSKNCKGTIKSLLNAGLTWFHNDRGRRDHFTMTGEDLCTVGVVSTQSDLCLAATLGLEHIERNGHHYHAGLSYLPERERRAALAAHPDFYVEEHGIIGPRIADGRFCIGSLHCAGFGFSVEPDMSTMEPVETWRFESLGL